MAQGGAVKTLLAIDESYSLLYFCVIKQLVPPNQTPDVLKKFIHDRQIIHEDIKPENIILKSPLKNLHKRENVALVDFGAAKVVNAGAIKVNDRVAKFLDKLIQAKTIKRWDVNKLAEICTMNLSARYLDIRGQ
ncbi:MAG TPA: hypothetical protein V6D12_08380 [Candidatus Obscuribacterales bacterium]